MSRIVVPGYPYEGSFYWLMSAEMWRGLKPKSSMEMGYGYYGTLYGRNSGSLIDETASLCILFDKIVLAPADCPLPDHKRYLKGSRYSNPDLGIISDWNWIDDRQLMKEKVELLLADFSLQLLLSRIPRTAWPQIIQGAVVQIELVDRFEASLLASPAYIRLCERIRCLLQREADHETIPPDRLLSGLSAVFNLASVRFSIESIDEFISLRSSNALRSYANSFLDCINQLPAGVEVEHALFKAMSEAINSSELAEKIEGGLSVSASALGILSMIPLLSLIAGGAVLSADAASRIIAKQREKHLWWALAPEVSKILSKSRIEAKLRALENK